MAASGWFTIGVVKSPPSLPALVTVNVEPRSSSGARVPARAASARRSTSSASSSTDFVVAAADDRDDEALVGLHGDADVVAVEVDDLLALEAGVQLGELGERLGDGLERRRHEAAEVDVAEVALLDPRDRRHLAVRAGHVLGDEPPDAAQPFPPSFLATARGLSPGHGCRAHVLFGHPPLRARAVQALEVDAELLGKPSDERRRPDTSRLARSRGLSPWHGRNGRCRLRFCARRTVRGGAVLADHDQHRAHRDDVALRDQDPGDHARRGRRDLDRRLVGLDLDERVVLRDLLPLRDEPARDLALGQALPEIGQLELVRHGRRP